MERNIYAPPKAQLKEAIKPVPRPKTAILVATLFDLLVSFAISIILGLAYGIYLAAQGRSPEEIQAIASSLDSTNPFFLLASFLGLLVSIVAGYLCARLSVRNIYRNATLVGALTITIAFALNFDESLTPFRLLLGLLEFPALFLGAWWYLRKQSAREGGL
jgi:hypothetical protein